MRTEQDLRETFDALAIRARPDEAQALARVRGRVLAATRPSSRRRRRALLVLAAAVVLIALAVALPGVVNRRTAVPADTRAPGNWNLIHRFDLPAGWEQFSTSVQGTRESFNLRTPIGSETPDEGCYGTLWARGAYTPKTTGSVRRPVDVNGRAGVFVPDSDSPDDLTGVTWPYADDAWATISCSRDGATDQDVSLDLARRMRLEPTATALPFRLRSLPDGYQVGTVLTGLTADSPVPSTGIYLTPVQADAGPTITIADLPGTAEVPPGLPGYETDTVADLPAVLNGRDMTLALNVQGRQIVITAAGGVPADLSVSLWPAGRRELLVEVAESLKLARSQTDQASWFDANEALHP